MEKSSRVVDLGVQSLDELSSPSARIYPSIDLATVSDGPSRVAGQFHRPPSVTEFGTLELFAGNVARFGSTAAVESLERCQQQFVDPSGFAPSRGVDDLDSMESESLL